MTCRHVRLIPPLVRAYAHPLNKNGWHANCNRYGLGLGPVTLWSRSCLRRIALTSAAVVGSLVFALSGRPGHAATPDLAHAQAVGDGTFSDPGFRAARAAIRCKEVHGRKEPAVHPHLQLDSLRRWHREFDGHGREAGLASSSSNGRNQGQPTQWVQGMAFGKNNKVHRYRPDGRHHPECARPRRWPRPTKPASRCSQRTTPTRRRRPIPLSRSRSASRSTEVG